MLDKWHKKEKPVFTGITRGVGGFGFGGGGGGSPAVPVLSASGGTKSQPGDGYTYHVFTTNDTFNVAVGGEDIEVLLVAGGGGGNPGGDSAGGGGGAGGLVYRHSIPVNPGDSFPIVIGAGGAGASNGGNTTGFSLTAIGGGQGQGRSSNGTSGGNGGAGSQYTSGGPIAGYPGTQPSQNPGVPNLTQYGNKGYGPGDAPLPFYQPRAGGSGNANNDRSVNATFPNGSTILSGSPIGSNAISRGGIYSTSTSDTWPGASFGSGGRGTPAANTGGIKGVVVVRYGFGNPPE